MSSKKYDDVSIYFDKSRNKFSARVTVEKGKPRKMIRGDTEEEVLLKARQLMYSAKDETYMQKKGIPLIDLIKLNFEKKDSANQIGDAQYHRTLHVIKYIENSKIGKKNVLEITENDYQNFFNELTKIYADSSIDKYYTEIQQALKYGKRKKIIDDNLLEDVIKPKSKLGKREIKTFTKEKQKILSDYLFNLTVDDYEYKNVLLIQLYMGLRIGEALALKKEDINLKDRQIHIQRTLTEDRDGNIVIGEMTKTFCGNRVLPIPDIIFECVKEQMEISENNKDNLLFLNKGKLVRHTSINDQFKRRLVNLDIFEKGFSTHSLRHTYATRCIEGGMPAIVLSKLLGHSDIRITLNTYVKVFNEYQTKVAKQVEDYYKDINLTRIEDIPFKIANVQEEIEEQQGAKIIQFPKVVNDYNR